MGTFMYKLYCNSTVQYSTTSLYVQIILNIYKRIKSNWERGSVRLSIYNVQFVRIISLIDSLLHDWAIYKISTFCTSVAWQIIEAIFQQAISGNLIIFLTAQAIFFEPTVVEDLTSL